MSSSVFSVRPTSGPGDAERHQVAAVHREVADFHAHVSRDFLAEHAFQRFLRPQLLRNHRGILREQIGAENGEQRFEQVGADARHLAAHAFRLGGNAQIVLGNQCQHAVHRGAVALHGEKRRFGDVAADGGMPLEMVVSVLADGVRRGLAGIVEQHREPVHRVGGRVFKGDQRVRPHVVGVVRIVLGAAAHRREGGEDGEQDVRVLGEHAPRALPTEELFSSTKMRSGDTFCSVGASFKAARPVAGAMAKS